MNHRIVVVAFLVIAAGSAAALEHVEAGWAEWPVRTVAADPPRTETVALSPVWRLDCAEDAELMVGRISEAAPGLEGRVLLADKQLDHVLVIAPDGSVERTVGRAGEGPGEVSNVNDVVQLPDGRIGILEGGRAPGIMFGGTDRLVLLDGAGDPAGVVTPAGAAGEGRFPLMRNVRCAAGQLLVVSQRYEVSPPHIDTVGELTLLDGPDAAPRCLGRTSWRSELGDQSVVHEVDVFEVFAMGRADLAADGRVAFAPYRDRYLVAVRQPDGSGFCLDSDRPACANSQTEQDYMNGIYGDGAALDYAPRLRRVRWRPDGRLWVEPGDPAARGDAFACFDEYEADGTYVRRVLIDAPGDPVTDLLFVMEDGRMVLARGFRRLQAEDEEPEEDVVMEVVLLETAGG